MTVLANQILQDGLTDTEGLRKAEECQNSIQLQETPTPEMDPDTHRLHL